MNQTRKNIIIVGGGFGGVRCALDLARKNISNTKITLISDKPHFEYHAALYRVVTGKSPLEVCIPLRAIFAGKKVDVIQDTINEVDLEQKNMRGTSGSRYSYDFVVLALGSETAYFSIRGLQQFSFGFKSITEALILKQHLHELAAQSKVSDQDQDEDVRRMHFIVVGGGASGTELAGELAAYSKELASKHQIDPSLITIDLIEAAPRLLSLLPADMSARIKEQLHQLGVNIFLNRVVTDHEVEQIYLKDMEIKTKTVIWTAGTKPHHLMSEIKGLECDKRGRVIVNDYLQPKAFNNAFVVGDSAATQYSGMAQTASHDGAFVASAIEKTISGQKLSKYQPQKPVYAIPVGPGWAAVLINSMHFYGKVGWWLRRAADLRFFLSILPPYKAYLAFRSGKTLCESCTVCLPEQTQPTKSA